MLGVYDYDWPQIWCDAVKEAIWSTQATPAINALPEYSQTHRKKGVTNFAFLASESLYPLAGWRFIRAPISVHHGIQRFKTYAIGEFKIARFGFDEPDGSTKPTKWLVARDLRRAQEAIYRQPSLSGLAYGPFGVQNTTTVGGQGSGRLTGTLYPTFEVEDPFQVTTPGHPDNLGPMVWLGRMLVTIPFIHT